MVSVHSRRRPYPFDIEIDDVPMMLRPDENGLLVARKMQTLDNAVPSSAEYSTQPPYKERGAVLLPLDGMGEGVQASGVTRRYHYALNAWRVGRLTGLGPKWTALAPASTGEVRDFPEALHGGAVTQFILAGRYVLRRGGDTSATQTVSKDFGASTQANAAVRFKGAYASPVDGLYVGVSNGELWEYDGTNWNACTLIANLSAQYVEKVGDELWAGGGNTISKCTGDPKLAASWSGLITVGDGSHTITALKQENSRLFIFTNQGGVFTLNGDGTENDLFPGLRATPAATNGRAAANGFGFIWFRHGDSFVRVSADDGAQLSSVGADRLLDNRSEVRGPISCFAAHGTYGGYMGMQGIGGSSYLLSVGQWVPTDGGDARYVFDDVLDGALVVWAGKTITALRATALMSGNPRLYAGFSDGTFGFVKLPKGGASPFVSDSGCEFTTEGSITWGRHHATFPADDKQFRAVSKYGPLLDPNHTAQTEWRITETGSFQVVPTRHVSSGQRIDLTSATGGTIAALAPYTVLQLAPYTVSVLGVTTETGGDVTGRAIELRTVLRGPGGSTTPLLEVEVLHESVRPALQLEQAAVVMAHNHVGKRDGSTDRRHTATQIRDTLRSAAGRPGSVSVRLPDEVSQTSSLVQYEERLRPDQRRYGLEWDCPITLVDYRTNETYGTVARLASYLVGDLEPYQVQDLGVL